jgi:hypothetical protein
VNAKHSARRIGGGRTRVERKVARGARGLWFVIQRVEGAKGWVPLAGAKLSRQEALAYLARSFSRRTVNCPSTKLPAEKRAPLTAENAARRIAGRTRLRR